MRSSVLRYALLASTLKAVAAQSPPGFTPVTSNHLNVTYRNSTVIPAGVTAPLAALVDAPRLGLQDTNNGTYVAVMLDFSDKPMGPNGPNATFLHWLIPGLSSANKTATLTSHEAPIAPYIAPLPSPGETHTYAIFLYNEPKPFSIPADYIPYFNNLTASVSNRVGFNLTKFAEASSLGDPVAADWFLVSNLNVTASPSGSTATATTSSVVSSATAATTSVTSGRSTNSPSAVPTASLLGAGSTVRIVESIMVAIAVAGLALNMV